MGKTAILGVVLIVLGIGGLLLGHFSYTETKPVLKAGPLQINSEEQHNISIPTIGSIVLLLAGLALVVTGRGKRVTAAPQIIGVQGASGPANSDELPFFARAANAVSHAAGRPAAFVLCCVTVIAWAVCGPIFHYSDTWQLVINTGTTIVTFLMVFLIQNSQNRDGAALQAKLDELIRVTREARNDFVGIEAKPEKTLEEMRADCRAEAEQDRALTA